MSEAEQLDQSGGAPDAEVEEEAIFIKKEITVDMDQLQDGEVPQQASVETADVEEEKSAQPVDEDRTEDQVPDITGTENIDPMTTSMDGIEDLPANEESQEYEDAIMEENEDEKQEDDAHVEAQDSTADQPTPDHDDSKSSRYRSAYADIPQLADDVIPHLAEDEHEQATGDSEAAAASETDAAAAPADETHPSDEPVAEEVSAAENEIPVAETSVEVEASAEPPVAETTVENEEKAPAEEEKVEEKVEAEEQMAPPGGTPVPGDAEKEFELQAPPEGKRPRTPNELDNPPPEEPVEEAAGEPAKEVEETPQEVEEPPKEPEEAPQEMVEVPVEVEEAPKEEEEEAIEKTEVSQQEATPATPATPAASEKVESVPQTPKSAVGSVPPTPMSATKEAAGTPAGSVPPTPNTAAEEKFGTPAGSVPATPKTEEKFGTPVGTPKMANGALPNGSIPGTPTAKVETPKVATPKGTGTPKATGTPKTNVAFNFEETPATPKETEAPGTPAKSAKSPRTPRTPKTPKTPKSAKSLPAEEPEPLKEEPVEPEPAPAAEETPAEEAAPVEEEHAEAEPAEAEPAEAEPEEAKPEPEPELIEVEVTGEQAEDAAPAEETHAEEAQKEPEEEIPPPTKVSEVTAAPARKSPSPPPVRQRAASPSPPRRARPSSPSPERRPARDYTSYDQDSHRHVPPPRLPTTTSFSSWSPPEKSSYTAISPFVTNPNKYRNEYTASCNYRPNNTYLSHFDDIVNSGAFSSALYSTTRLIERSRSRTRERRQAMRSQRSMSNYYRYLYDSYTSQYPAPQRAREYSTPPSREYSRPPSRSGSFISFMEYSGSKNGELSRNASRSSIYDSALSRSGSRVNNADLYYGGGRLSRVDSYVRDLHTPYEYEMPSTYERYRSSSRSGGFSTISGYTGRIGQLERSLSRELLTKDRLRSEYSQLSSKLNQAVRQMDLLRATPYSSMRSASHPRTSIYAHFYPYY
ncbi:hypothetical protein V3C99_017720 [Haemonchus contortus]